MDGSMQSSGDDEIHDSEGFFISLSPLIHVLSDLVASGFGEPGIVFKFFIVEIQYTVY